MPTLGIISDRYSGISSSSLSQSSSASSHRQNNQTKNSLSQSSMFLPLSDSPSPSRLSKLSSNDYRSMQSLRSPQIYSTKRVHPPPVARISPRIIESPVSLSVQRQALSFKPKDEHWLSCEALETIEKRFTDLLRQDINQNKTNDYQLYDQRAKSCDRLVVDERDYHSTTLAGTSQCEGKKQTSEEHNSRLSSVIAKRPLQSRSRSAHQNQLISSKDLLKVEASYRSIGTQVFVARSLCDLYITTADRLAKLEDWIFFQHGLPVWLFNSGTNPHRPCRLSLLIAEYGSGFPVWEDIIDASSEVKQARAQHITFRLSDQNTLAVLRFADLSASKEFFNSYLSIRNNPRYQHLFNRKSTQVSHRSSSCSSVAAKKNKSKRSLNKSTISNPCQFQHINSLQIHDRRRIISLDNCLMSSPCYPDELL